ncbi:MAG: MvaI/BcnI family restriction endonuclease [Candidatus Thorarchaeota archaeon]
MTKESKDDDTVQTDLEGNPIEEQLLFDKTRKKRGGELPILTEQELRDKLEAIKNKGWIRGLEMGDGSHGHTLEYLLEVPENNLSIPDLGQFELKASLAKSGTLLTLFTKAPKRVGNMKPALFVQNYGYWDSKKNRQSLNVTISTKEVNSRGWKLEVNYEEEQISFLYNEQCVANQDFNILQNILNEKIVNLALVIAERKTPKKLRIFRYTEAYLLTEINDNIADLIDRGIITIDWRMHVKDTGKARDHGAAYRIKEGNLSELYKDIKRII